MTHIPAADNQSLESLVAQLADEFGNRLERGEQPAIDEYAQRHPQHAGVIRNVLTALQFMRLSAADRSGMAATDDYHVGLLGDFRIIREVGRGGMGVVYEAEQVSLNRRVALKVLPFAATLDPRQLQRFKNEAQAAAQLHHTNMVPVHYVGCERGTHFYAMQFIDGVTLAAAIADLRLQIADLKKPDKKPDADATRAYPAPAVEAICNLKSEICNPTIIALSTERSLKSPAFFRTVAQLGIQATEALDYAHQVGIVHRDIKPANLMLETSSPLSFGRGVGGEGKASEGHLRLWVTDFGLAHIQHAEGAITMSGDLIGTLRYMSPEQALAKRVLIDHRTDISSLGATLYELLTLEPVFHGRDRQDLLRQIAFDDPRPPRKLNKAIPAELETIVMKALEKNPADRYATAQEMADDLRHYLHDEPIRARRPRMVQRVRKWGRRHNVLTAGVAVFLLTALLFGGGALVREWSAATVRQREADLKASAAMDQVRDKVRTGRDANDLALLADAHKDAHRAADTAAGARPEVREEAQALRQEVEDTLAAAKKHADLTAALLDVSEPRETKTYLRDDKGVMMTLAQPSSDEQFAAAFRRWGADVDRLPPAQLLARLQALPGPVLHEVVSGLDAWAQERRRQKRPEAEWRRPHALAEQLDGEARRQEIRRIGASGQPQEGRARLEELAGQMDVRQEPVLGLVLLARALEGAGSSAAAEGLLRTALTARPGEVVLLDGLGKLLERQRPPRWGEAIECYRAIRVARPGTGIALAMALVKAGRAAEGEEVLRDLARRQPHNPEMHFYLGYALADQKKLGEAVAAYHKAIDLEPDDPDAYNNLGVVLCDELKAYDKAIASFRKVIDLKPTYAEAHFNLGNALYYQKKLGEAVAAYRKAIDLKPDYPDAHHNLACALRDQKKLAEAVAAFRKAIDLKPDDPDAYNNLGVVLCDELKAYDKAIASFRKVIDLKPNCAVAHYNLGNALRKQNRLDEAVAAYRKALELQPDYPFAYCNLGIALIEQKKLGEAVAALRKAIDLKADFPFAYCNLGNALRKQNRLDEAVAAYRKAIDLQPDFPTPYSNLGDTLREQKKLGEAVAALRKADQLLPGHPVIRNNLRLTERWLELDRKLPAFLPGKEMVQSADEQIELAGFSASYKENYRAAASLYADAFAAEPKLVADLNAQHRYNAACAAALAGCGKGQDADNVELKDRAKLRQQALDWLQADLKAYQQALESSANKAGPGIAQRMNHWLGDADFAGVRGSDALGRLPESERQQWQKLWQEVAALQKSASQAPQLATPKSDLKQILALAREGIHDDAVNQAMRLASEADHSASFLHDWSRVYALSAAAVKNDARLHGHYTSTAIELLRQAVANGWRGPARLRNDDDFRELRPLTDFQRLASEMEKRK